MLDLHRLRLLQEFAARGSIARTAAVLGYTPSAVSQQLAALEREAGTALLDRSARRAELTDAGRRLAGHAERILAMVEEAETDLSTEAQEPAGRVVATAFPSGRASLAVKLADVAEAVNAGADEVDMVIDRAAFLAGRYAQVYEEVRAVREACGTAHLKVILETGQLATLDNTSRSAWLAMLAGYDFIVQGIGGFMSITGERDG